MNTLTTGIRNWQSTVIGVALAVLLIMQETDDLSNWKVWVIPALIAALGIITRDANKSSVATGVKLLIIGLCATTFIACTPTAYQVDLTNYETQVQTTPEAVVIQAEDVTPIGGFKVEGGAKIITDEGTIDITESGLTGEVVVDLRSGK